MKLGDINEQYIFYTEIDLGEGEFVKLREPSISEVDSLTRAEDKDKIIEAEKLFPNCLVDHSFTKNDDPNKKASREEVYKELRKSGTLFLEILETWMQSFPFRNRLQKQPK
jgi:hypothetical protein